MALTKMDHDSKSVLLNGKVSMQVNLFAIIETST